VFGPANPGFKEGFVAAFEKLLIMILVLCGVLGPSLFAQQVTTEMIGPFSVSFTLTYPKNPVCPASGQQDTITFTGNVHVSATVDTTQNTVDYHINFLSVKGTGTLVSKYVASGATDLLDQGFPGANITVPIQISGNLFPSNPRRAAYPLARYSQSSSPSASARISPGTRYRPALVQHEARQHWRFAEFNLEVV
jgi:hypothetical protein